MAAIVAFSGIIFVALGAVGWTSPARLLAFLSWWHERPRLLWAAAFRLVLGTALVLAAPVSRAPIYLQVVGVGAVLLGIATPWVGVRRFANLIGTWRNTSPSRVRPWCVVPMLLGLSLLWAAWPF